MPSVLPTGIAPKGGGCSILIHYDWVRLCNARLCDPPEDLNVATCRDDDQIARGRECHCSDFCCRGLENL